MQSNISINEIACYRLEGPLVESAHAISNTINNKKKKRKEKEKRIGGDLSLACIVLVRNASVHTQRLCDGGHVVNVERVCAIVIFIIAGKKDH